MNVRFRIVVAALALGGAGRLDALSADRAITQYVRRVWTVEQGLPHGTVRGVVQTPDGDLWLATYEGLVRFNGEDFQILDRSSAPEMLSIAVRMVAHGGGDTLWLGTNAGLMRYRGGRFETIALPGGPDIIGGMAVVSDGTVWIGTTGGKLVRVANGRAEEKTLVLPVSPSRATSTSGDSVWIGTSAVLSRHRRGAKTAERIEGLSSD